MTSRQRRQGTRMCVQNEMDKISPIIQGSKAANIPQLEVSISKLSSYKIDLQAHDDRVLGEITDPATVETEIKESAIFNDNLLEILSQATVFVQTTKARSTAVSAVQQNSGASSSGSTGRGVSLRLPKLELTPFSGELLEWQPFWDSFESAVHNNPQLSDIDKLNYLNSFLQGDAETAVKGYRLTAANYSTIVEELKQRYGDKQMAIFGHFEAMLAVPPASHDISKLQSVSDSCERHIRSLTALGLDESMFGQVFTPIMLSKLPTYVKMELHRKNGSQTWSLAHLREWLKDEIRARDLAQRNFGESSSRKSESQGPKGDQTTSKSSRSEKQSPSSASALVSNTPNKLPPKCAFCSEQHFSDHCSKYPTVASRRQQVADRCLNCLKSGHRVKECRQKIPCAHCKRTGHHRSMCYSKFGKPDDSKPAKTETGLNIDAVESVLSSETQSGTEAKRTILQTAVTQLSDVKSKSQCTARLLFDTAASRTFVTEAKRAELNLPVVGEELVSVSGFQSSKRKTSKFKLVEIMVQCRDGSMQTISASVVPSITCPVQKIPLDVAAFPILKQLQLSEPIAAQSEFVNIDVLIGLDYYYDFVGTERIECPDGPILLSSRLGYITTGRVTTNTTGPDTIAVMLLSGGVDSNPFGCQSMNLERYWDLEDIGIKQPVKDLCGDDEALMFHTASLKQTADGRYHSQWPWKKDHDDLPDNFDVAFQRLKSLLRQLSRNNDVAKAYRQTIDDQMSKNVIEVAPAVPSGPRVYYMPHHCVISPSRATTKLRVVYDASSKSSKDVPSLNECMHRGPILLGDLCGLLLRFRLHKIAMVSDIEKAFLQIGLQETDRDVTRFLWVKDTSLPPFGDNLLVLRFCRVPFGVKSSPFVLENTVNQHLVRVDTPVANQVKDNKYVDNVLAGEATAEEAIEHYHEAKGIFKSACMNLREWFTNSDDVRFAISEIDRGSGDEPKVLGLRWNTTRDTLRCSSPKPVTPEECSTKRTILRSIAEVFDPLGFFAPVTVAGKLLVQELWKSGLQWDDPLPADGQQKWNKISRDISSISVSEIPRLIDCVEKDSTFQIHVFCDASSKASAAAVYLRKMTPQKTSCYLLFAKTRLASIKQPQTIPRLELIAVLIGVRILAFVLDQLKLDISERFVWTDSMCTLHWLKRERVTARFIENRLKEIRKHSDIEFRYVPTSENPADLPSRGTDFKTLNESILWWHGPCWLSEVESSWPKQVIQEPIVEQTLSVPVVKPSNDALLEIDRFSSLGRLLRVTALVFRFVRLCRGSSVVVSSKQEIDRARTYWETQAQSQAYPDLVFFRGTVWPKGVARQLGLFKDADNRLRCGGRVDEANMSYNSKHPILLPKDHGFTKLCILECHLYLIHGGPAQTLAEMRKRYWVVHGRSTVRQVLRSCQKFRLLEGGPYKVPQMPVLPKERLENEPPFSYVGLDYLGPLYVKVSSGETKKVWICLFTCMVIRAIHLEVVSDLSAYVFQLALRRFMSHYGTPSYILSDNASQFHSSRSTIDKLWSELTSSEQVQSFALSRGIQWNFVPPYAPWMGGFYERLVGVVKKALKTALHGICATIHELNTTVCEITAVVNSRPITYVENEVGMLPLTPSAFLSQRTKPVVPYFDDAVDEFLPTTVHADQLVLKWKRLQSVTGQFWNTWNRQYLASLRERAVAHKQRNCSNLNPKIGSVVLIGDKQPRSQWKFGRIIKLHHGADQCIRSVDLKLPNGRITTRPVKILFPLELGCSDDCASAAGSTLQTSPMQRPKRKAAVKAQSRWQAASQSNGSASDCDSSTDA